MSPIMADKLWGLLGIFGGAGVFGLIAAKPLQPWLLWSLVVIGTVLLVLGLVLSMRAVVAEVGKR